MENSPELGSVSLEALAAYYDTIVNDYALGGIDAVWRNHGLVLAAAAVAVLVVLLLAVVVLMPRKRKVIRRRRVRVTRHTVAQQTAVPESQTEGLRQDEAPAEPDTGSPRGRKPPLVPIVAAIVVLAAFAATYVVTGLDAYCARTCHFGNTEVVSALETGHADCIDCHEGGPVSGAAARTRMVISYTLSAEETSAPTTVDPAHCLDCHDDVAQSTVETKSGLRVSHREVLSSGLTCSDCHSRVGHGEPGSLLQGVMDRCVVCHDGATASRACDTCHLGGSPLAQPRTVDSSASSFTYDPVLIASRDCTRCHGIDQECLDCHEGFLLPHPDEFREGGHAPIVAFDGKERCYKCHSLAWCGSDCHQPFSPHDPERWPADHQSGTSATCGSCHTAWDGTGNWCDVCH